MADPLFDDAARLLRRARALRREAEPFLGRRIVEELRERLVPVQRRFERALVTGCPPALEGLLEGAAAQMSFAPSLDALAAEEEASLDLLVIVGELDSRDELELLFAIARSRLRAGGLLLGAIPGGNGLPVLREALHAADRASGSFAPRFHPRIEPGALAGLLGAAGLAEPVVDVERLRLRYSSLSRLIGDLRDHGATNVLRARERRPLPRPAWRTAKQVFADRAMDGRTEELIEILFFAGWAPQRP